MDNNFTDDIVAVVSGATFSALGMLLKFDLNSFTVETMKTIEVLWLGIVGGVGGIIGKKIIDKIYKNKKNGNNDQHEKRK